MVRENACSFLRRSHPHLVVVVVVVVVVDVTKPKRLSCSDTDSLVKVGIIIDRIFIATAKKKHVLMIAIVIDI
jgi:hypothetical protein